LNVAHDRDANKYATQDYITKVEARNATTRTPDDESLNTELEASHSCVTIFKPKAKMTTAKAKGSSPGDLLRACK
jgi:hypothetical protein